VVSFVAAHLLVRTPAVLERFARDPFSDRPPTIVRMRRYRLTFTDLATYRRTGHYWRKEFAGEFLPAVYAPAPGGIARFSLTDADAALAAGNVAAALRLYEAQLQLGNLDAAYRLADLYSGGAGGPAQPEKVHAIFTDLAARGEVRALHNLGLCHEFGVGVPVDLAKAADFFRQAAERGNLRSRFLLGKLAAEDRLVPRGDIEGLASLLTVAQRVEVEEPLLSQIRAEQPALEKRLTDRMSPDTIAQARTLAAQWR
jgi:TPR repeat protein